MLLFPSQKKNPPALRLLRSGFTLIELLVVIAVIGVLVTIVGLAIGGVRERAISTVCLSNLRSCGVAFSLFRQDNDQHFPSNGRSGNNRWMHKLTSYLGVDDPRQGGYLMAVVHCPLTPVTEWRDNPNGGAYGSYGINTNIAPWRDDDRGLSYFEVENPEKKVLLTELSWASYKGVGAGNSGANVTAPFPGADTGSAANHRADQDPSKGPDGPSNYLFADGHVETLEKWPGANAFDPRSVQ